jgi:hypothetical protein
MQRVGQAQAVGAFLLAAVLLVLVPGCTDNDTVRTPMRGVLTIAAGSRGKIIIRYDRRGDCASAIYLLGPGSSTNAITLAEGCPAKLVLTVGKGGEVLGLNLGGADFSIFAISGTEHRVMHDGKEEPLVRVWEDLCGSNSSFVITRDQGAR